MGSLADLVGPVERIIPPITVNVGEIMVTLRHNAPRDIVRPGKKLRRGRGLPATLDPHGIRVSTEDIPVDVEVPTIALAGSFGLPLVELRIVIRVEERGNYGSLRRYIADKGINFAELLDGDLANEMDMHVREALAGYDIEDLHAIGNVSRIIGTSLTLLEGLFRVESVQQKKILWDPEYEAIQRATAAAQRERAEKVLRLGQIPIDHEVMRAEDELALEAARRRGVSLWELEHPEQVSQAAQNEHELRLEAIKQIDAIRRGAGADGVRAVLGMPSQDETATRKPTYQPPAPRVLAPASGSPPGGAGAGGAGSASGDGLGAAGRDEGPRQRSDGLDRLGYDHALAQVWEGARLPGRPFGLARAGQPPNATVVAIVDVPLGPDEVETISQAIRRLIGADHVVAIGRPRNMSEIIVRFLTARVPAIGHADARWTFHIEGTTLNIAMGSATERLGPIVREITDPVAGVLAPLERLLPFDAIDVRVADVR